MDNSQLMIIVNAGAIGCAIFFIKLWMNTLKETQNKLREDNDKLRDRLDLKVDVLSCDRMHRLVEKIAHTHGSTGSAGEMINR